MNNILYYSNKDALSREVTRGVSALPLNFICTDNRVSVKDGREYCVLQDGSHVILPRAVTQVPAMVVVTAEGKSRGVLFGTDILDFYRNGGGNNVSNGNNNNQQQQVAPAEFEPSCYTDSNFGKSSSLCAVSAFGDTASNVDLKWMDSAVSVGNPRVENSEQFLQGDRGAEPQPKMKGGDDLLNQLNTQREADTKQILAQQSRSEFSN